MSAERYTTIRSNYKALTGDLQFVYISSDEEYALASMQAKADKMANDARIEE